MPRTRLILSLSKDEHNLLKKLAKTERTLPATLATRLLLSSLHREFSDAAPKSPTLELADWLAPQLDAIRNAGAWPEDITVEIFDRIEREQGDLYAAAAAEKGQSSLNMHLGRFIRMRLAAQIVPRNGKPYVSRVPASRTRLIKNYTHLAP